MCRSSRKVAAAPSIGNLEAGALANATNLTVAIASGGILCVIGCGVLAVLFPALSRYDASKPVAQT